MVGGVACSMRFVTTIPPSHFYQPVLRCVLFCRIYDVRVEQSDLEKIIVDHMFGFFVTKEDQAQVG